MTFDQLTWNQKVAYRQYEETIKLRKAIKGLTELGVKIMASAESLTGAIGNAEAAMNAAGTQITNLRAENATLRQQLADQRTGEVNLLATEDALNASTQALNSVVAPPAAS